MFWIIFFCLLSVLIRMKDWVFWISNEIELTQALLCSPEMWAVFRDNEETPVGELWTSKWSRLLLPSGWEMIQIHVTSDSGTCASEKSWSKYDATFILNFMAQRWSAWLWNQTEAFSLTLLLTNLISLYKVLVPVVQFLICRMAGWSYLI